MFGASFWFTYKAVVVPWFTILSEFVACVFVAVMVNVFVTVRFEAMRFAKFEVPDAIIPPCAVKSPVVVSVPTDSDPTFKVAMFAKGVTNEWRFEIEETLRFDEYKNGILIASKLNTRFDVFAVNAGVEIVDETFRVSTFAKGVTNELRFEIAETLRDPRVSDPTLSVETLAKGVTNELRFEIEETLRESTLAKSVTKEFRFEIEETFRELVLKVPRLAKGVTKEFRFEIEETLRESTLAKGVTNELRFEIEETFRFDEYKNGTLIVSKVNSMLVVFAVNAGVDMFDATTIVSTDKFSSCAVTIPDTFEATIFDAYTPANSAPG
jgi:hypothetical protein